MYIKSIKKDIFQIVLVNILSQGFLLILTGTFWDDWAYYYHDKVSLWKQFMEAGRPSSAYWIEAVWNLPHYGYRWLVFLLFLFTSIIFYMLLSNSNRFSRDEALYLSILYTVFPINDCRVILCDFVYTIGLFSFFVGCYIFLLWSQAKTRRKYLLRIIALCFFGYSFIINSLLMYYAIVLLCILYTQYIHDKKIMKAVVLMFRQYIDFIILPVVFL